MGRGGLIDFKNKAAFIFIILSFTVLPIHGQEAQEYDITVAGFPIGTLETYTYSKGDSLYYELKSKVNFWFFGRVNVEVENTSVYFGDRFITSSLETNTNKKDFKSTVILQEDQYKVDANTYKYELSTVIEEPVYFSSSRLHFEEPVNQRFLLAENYGLISPIQKKEDYYEVNVNGNRNRYYYVNGKLDKAVMESPIKNYVIKKAR